MEKFMSVVRAVLGVVKDVLGAVITAAVILGALYLGAFMYGTTPLRFLVLGAVYIAGMLYCTWRISANYRGEDEKSESDKTNGSFWVLFALIWTYVSIFAGAAVYLWEKVPGILAVGVPLAVCALGSHFLRGQVWDKFVKTIGQNKSASIMFRKTRLSLISKDDPRFFYRLARKFMQHTRKEGDCVVLPGLFTIGDEADAQISTKNEPLPFTSQEMTPDKFNNYVTWNLVLGIDEDDPSASTKYGDFEAVKQPVVAVINSAVTPWISREEILGEGAKAETPQTWWELRQQKEKMRRIAIGALLITFNPALESAGTLEATIDLAMKGRVVKLPLLGRVLKLITCDVRTEKKVEDKAADISLEALEREAELEDTETQAQKAQKILQRTEGMTYDQSERFIRTYGLVADLELVKDGHGHVIRGDPGLGGAAIIADAISGRGSRRPSQAPADPASSQSTVLPPPRSSSGKRRGRKGG